MKNSKREEFLKITLEALMIQDANNTCMNVDECAEFLGVHKNTVLNNIHKRNIKASLIGRVWSIPKLQFLDQILKR